MKYTFLEGFSEHTRVWVYQSDRDFSTDEISWIQQQGALFVTEWASHGTKLKATLAVLYNRFVVLAADQAITANSGCSIDASMRFIQQIERQFNLSLTDRMLVSYKEGETLKYAPFTRLGELKAQGLLSEDTLVFNNLVSTLTEFENKWETAIKDSWHARFINS